MALIGFHEAIHCKASGIDWTGTNALLTNVSGKITTNTMPCTASADRAFMPIHVPTQIIAEAKAIRSRIAWATCSGSLCVLQPMSRPVVRRIVIARITAATSDTKCPTR